jgi:hypothetical protein
VGGGLLETEALAGVPTKFAQEESSRRGKPKGDDQEHQDKPEAGPPALSRREHCRQPEQERQPVLLERKGHADSEQAR